jgi:protein kinase C substrate 80K-H
LANQIDCCDGSDEYDGKVSCANTCNELAAKMKEEQEKLKKLKEEGFVKRKELIEASNELKKALQVLS